MRKWVWFVVSLVAGVAAAGEKAPPLEDVLAQAKASGKPVLLDVYTAWCKPCAKLDAEVFPHALVKTELSRWVFQRYDAEGDGRAVAERFGVNSYPSLIVVAPDGVEISRVLQQEPAPLAAALRAIYDEAAAVVPDAATLATTKDALVLMAAARRATNELEAAALWRRAADADVSADKKIAARAALKAAKADVAREVSAAQGRALASIVKRYPSTREALRAFTGLSTLPASARPTALLAECVEALSKARAEKGAGCELNDALYALLNVDEKALAAKLGARVLETCDDPEVMDSVAEVHHQLGESARAIAIEERALALAPANEGLEKNLARFKAKTPGYEPVPFSNPLVDAPARASGPPPAVVARLARINQIARAIGEPCDGVPHQVPFVWTRVRIAKGKARAVVLDPEISPALKKCIEQSTARNADAATLDDGEQFQVRLRVADAAVR
ncbi:MAG: thioredoxin family protein [Myxococcota bacterium]